MFNTSKETNWVKIDLKTLSLSSKITMLNAWNLIKQWRLAFQMADISKGLH